MGPRQIKTSRTSGRRVGGELGSRLLSDRNWMQNCDKTLLRMLRYDLEVIAKTEEVKQWKDQVSSQKPEVVVVVILNLTKGKFAYHMEFELSQG